MVVWRGTISLDEIDGSMLIVVSFWLMHTDWCLVYGLVHFEDRFMALVLSAWMVGALFYRIHALPRLSRARARLLEFARAH